MTMYAWLIAIILFGIIEAATVQLVSVWFAGGAVAAFIAALAGASISTQWICFVAVSALLLVFTKPLIKKVTHRETEKTNVDAHIGKTTVVTRRIDNISETGEVKLNGISWTARSANGEIIEVGKTVLVEKVEGVKLIVKSI